MKQDYHQLLKPETINSVSGLSLISRVIVDGYLSGLNKSNRVGPGIEFSQYRGYEQGDDMRLLDWKMLARSGRYYIKQSEIDTHVTVKFVLDSSKSMLHSESGLSKMDYVKVIVATLAYLAQNQGDAVGFFAINDKNIFSLKPTIQKQHLSRLLHELINISVEGEFPTKKYAFDKLHDRSRKELIFFISDLYESDGELTEIIKSLKTSQNEVVVMHIMGESELEFDYSGQVIFEDLESGKKLKVDTKEAKKNYLESLKTSVNRTKEVFLTKGIDYHLFNLKDHIGEVLQMFLKKRSRLN